jgi:hypothetical protein
MNVGSLSSMHNVLHRRIAAALLAALSAGCSGDDGGETGDTAADPPKAAVCQDYAAWELECGEAPGLDEADVAQECERGREYAYAVFGPTCGPLHDVLLACDAAHGCEPDDACQAAQDAYDDCVPEPGEVCERYAANVVGCADSEVTTAEVASECQLQINAGAHEDPACGAATEALHACFADASCDEIAGRTACAAEVTEQSEVCPFGE